VDAELSYRKIVYRMLMISKPLYSQFDFYTLLMSNEGSGFNRFMDSRVVLAFSIIRDGTAVPLTDFVVKRRRALGLPTLNFDGTDSKKIAEKIRLLKC
jgi:hypothetical protein